MSGSIRARGGTREMTIHAVVTRADGRVEDLGIVSYHHKNPLRRWAFQIGRFIKSIARRK